MGPSDINSSQAVKETLQLRSADFGAVIDLSHNTARTGEQSEIRLPSAEMPKDHRAESTTYIMSPRRKKAVFTAMCLSVFIACLEIFVTTIALPDITRRLRASDSEFAWIVSAYLLLWAAGNPVWAQMSDIFGRKLIYRITSLLFILGAILAATAQNSKTLITERAIQGAGVGGVTVVINIWVVQMYQPRERTFYFGIIGAITALSSAIGPFVGGVLTEKLSWRWCFWIEVPFTTLSCIGIIDFSRLEHESKPLREGLSRIDWLGSLTVTGGTFTLTLGLQFGVSHHPWDSPAVVCLLVFGIVLIVVFILVQLCFATNPLMPLRFFRTIPCLAVLVGCFFQALITTAVTYFVPLYFQAVLRASPLMSGVYFFPTTITLALMWASVGHLIRKTGRYVEQIRLGATAIILGTGLFIDTQDYMSWPRIMSSQIVVAIGLGLSYQAPLVALYEVIPKADATAGTAAYQFLKQLGQTITIAFGQLILQSRIKAEMRVLPKTGIPDSVLQQIQEGRSIVSSFSSDPDHDKLIALRRAFVKALRTMWIFYTVIAAISLMASFGIPLKKMGSHGQKNDALDKATENANNAYL